MDPVIALAGAFARVLAAPLTVLHALEPNMSDGALVATTFFSGVVPTQPDADTLAALNDTARGALHTELTAANVSSNLRRTVSASSSRNLATSLRLSSRSLR